ncbi:hypothetical protein GCM10025881_26490 [Pseudolysinimonas kribbensis]|uniref:Uncharacterized protein n=1 Tax=Pseudolysinimonas kribbensis TaxID=433641 RepID=A0ABQ6K899_9MICO|nr:hypothetical protein GCM10025881_26490 [Pseudolysinimonas kribbensis]
MDALSRDVAVDERLGQALRHDRGCLELRQAQRDREGARPVRTEADPAGDPPELVARALDEQALRLQARAHRRPGGGDLVLVVLPQHVERAYDRGTASVEGSSNPPSRNVTPPRAAALAIRTRSGSISIPTTSTSGRSFASRSRSSRVVVAERP